jgi:hypothetical protein
VLAFGFLETQFHGAGMSRANLSGNHGNRFTSPVIDCVQLRFCTSIVAQELGLIHVRCRCLPFHGPTGAAFTAGTRCIQTAQPTNCAIATTMIRNGQRSM